MCRATSHYLTIAGREIHFLEWGGEHARTAVLWHGFARTCRDMDPLARRLARSWRVLCPDSPGRGLSQWVEDPTEYNVVTYLAIAQGLLDALGIADCVWVGTSMGGGVGMAAAGIALKERVRRLIVNDIGPDTPVAALQRIANYVGDPPVCATMIELEALLRQIYRPFGFLSDPEWRLMAETGSRRLPDGRLTFHYDPRIVDGLRAGLASPDMIEAARAAAWATWDQIACPVLILRGEESDVLPAAVAEEMTRRGPPARLATFPLVGHAPALNVPEQIEIVVGFLDGRS